jgi:hypothetical protein
LPLFGFLPYLPVILWSTLLISRCLYQSNQYKMAGTMHYNYLRRGSELGSVGCIAQPEAYMYRTMIYFGFPDECLYHLFSVPIARHCILMARMPIICKGSDPVELSVAKMYTICDELFMNQYCSHKINLNTLIHQLLKRPFYTTVTANYLYWWTKGCGNIHLQNDVFYDFWTTAKCKPIDK